MVPVLTGLQSRILNFSADSASMTALETFRFLRRGKPAWAMAVQLGRL